METSPNPMSKEEVDQLLHWIRFNRMPKHPKNHTMCVLGNPGCYYPELEPDEQWLDGKEIVGLGGINSGFRLVRDILNST